MLIPLFFILKYYTHTNMVGPHKTSPLSLFFPTTLYNLSPSPTSIPTTSSSHLNHHHHQRLRCPISPTVGLYSTSSTPLLHLLQLTNQIDYSYSNLGILYSQTISVYRHEHFDYNALNKKFANRKINQYYSTVNFNLMITHITPSISTFSLIQNTLYETSWLYCGIILNENALHIHNLVTTLCSTYIQVVFSIREKFCTFFTSQHNNLITRACIIILHGKM